MDIGSIVRVGKVDSVNAAKKTARVRFEDLDNMVSGDLPVLQHPAAVTVNETALTYDQGGVSATVSHGHDANMEPWMPSLGQQVVCLYVPVENGDGYILGVLP